MKYLVFSFFFLQIVFAQGEHKKDSTFILDHNQKSLQKSKNDLITRKDIVFFIENNSWYFVDESRNLSFPEIQNSNFEKFSSIKPNYQATYWYRFKITTNSESKYIAIFSLLTDIAEVFIPYKEGYKAFNCGILMKSKKVSYDMGEASFVVKLTDSIDFKKPFYLKKTIISPWGKQGLTNPPAVMFTDHIAVVEKLVLSESFTDTIKVYSSIFIFSFFLFLFSFFITKDWNFFNYSLYLLATTLIFAVRIPFFFNFMNSIEPKLVNHITFISEISATCAYLYFIGVSLKFKDNYPKQYILYKYTLISMLMFGFSFALIKIINPFFPYIAESHFITKLLFSFIALGICISLLLKKLYLASRVILFGSLFLILGNALTLILSEFRIFLNTVVIEIILFFSALSYINRQNSEQAIKNELILIKEKQDKNALIKLDALKSKFFTNISHEFRTPLTLISGPIQQLLKKKDLPESERSNFEMIHRNSFRMLSLVDQLLDLSKIKSGSLKLNVAKDNIMAFIGALTDGFTFLSHKKEINYKVYINSSSGEHTWFDKDVLDKIIVNLLSNALKYTPQNGFIVCHASVSESRLYFEIKNTGIGLSKEELSKIFQRFYQVDNNNEGIGIGLSLVKELVHLHKGTITVESTLNQWTLFKVEIPVNKTIFNADEFSKTKFKALQNKEYAFEDYSNTNENSIKVPANDENPILLIVDDNNDIRTYIENLFKNLFTIIKAKDGNEGIQLAIEYVPDIIISDVMMPNKTGIDLCNTLKFDERTSHVPIVLLTAKSGDENKLEGLKTGADAYITKPFNNEILLVRVNMLIDNRNKLRSRYSQEVILKPKDIAITSIDEQFLVKVQKVLDENLVESSFTSEAFSDAVAMSRMQLHRKLKALTGLSASEFIRSQRLKLAADILKQSHINISEVGYSVGFNDPAYFTKCFKEVYNRTPSQFASK